jgi:hypothetical protein
MPKKLNVTDLDFDQIRSNLKAYFTRKDSPFQDWDFEGSGLSNLLDVLAYNTHYNAMLAHMTLNEGFIDTAQLRESVVSHAKLLGYTPASKRASKININVVFKAAGSGKALNKITIARGAKFSSVLNGETYVFVVTESKTANLVNGFYSFTGDNQLTLAQGSLNRVAFVADSTISSQRFIITDEDIDTTTLRVFVRESASSTIIEKFNPFSSLSQTDSSSAIYFLSENYQGNFELTFGDGIYGKKVGNLQVIEAEYVSTLGSVANGAGSFTYISGILDTDSIAGAPTITLTTNENNVLLISSGGSDRETIENIRFTAPLSFVAQNRAVTANDYISIIQRDFGAVDAINVWGGEDQDPITPSGAGRVYISIKPQSSEVLNDTQKQKILSILEPKRVITLKTSFVDPDYTNLYFDVSFKYDESKSSLTRKELETALNTAITAFNTEYLQKFNGVFRYSKFLNYLDSVNPAIANTVARVYFYKIYDHLAGFSTTLNFGSYITNISYNYSNPNTVITVTLSEDFDLLSGWYVNFYGSTPVYENKPISVLSDYVFTFTVSGEVSSLSYVKAYISRASSTYPSKIDFSNGLYGRQDDDSQTNLISSSVWTLRYDNSTKLPTEIVSGSTSETVYLKDEPIIDSPSSPTYNTRTLALYSNTTKARLFTVGNVHLETGIVYLTRPIVNVRDESSKPQFYAIPDSNDVAPKRNQLLTIDMSKTTVTGEIDTILSGGSAGAINYNTFKK